jgi:predicted ribosomally synthesized peptide with SipW-like signal peptide
MKDMKTLGAIKSLLSLKVVLMGVMVMAVAGGLIGGGLFAYFSDTETSTGNTFTAGTIDIGVDGENPWQETFHMEVKPCEMGLVEFDIQNVGTNPVDVWKHIWVTDVTGGMDDSYYCGIGHYPTPTEAWEPIYVSSEPECEAEGSYWDPETQQWDASWWYPNDFLFWDTTYDIYAGQCIIEEWEGLPLYVIAGYELPQYGYNEGYWLYLGQIDPEDSMPVSQSYHLMDWYSPQNYYQGDTIYFDIELYAQQTTGNVEPPYPQWDYSEGCPPKYGYIY